MRIRLRFKLVKIDETNSLSTETSIKIEHFITYILALLFEVVDREL